MFSDKVRFLNESNKYEQKFLLITNRNIRLYVEKGFMGSMFGGGGYNLERKIKLSDVTGCVRSKNCPELIFLVKSSYDLTISSKSIDCIVE